MQSEEVSPTLGQGMLRLATLFAVIASIAYAFCCMFTQDAALQSLSTYAARYHYTQSCDDEGKVVSSGPTNCVDLNKVVFVDGTVMKAYFRECSGVPEASRSSEVAKLSRTEIISLKKALQWYAQFGSSPPCGPHGR
ncbi:hypothetical protein D3C71_1148230 [compost metagenome]